MKRNLFSILMFCTFIFFAACSDDKDEDEKKATTLALSVSEILFIAEGAEKTFEIACDGSWTIGETPEWTVLDKKEGKGNATIKVTTKTNDTKDDRSGKIAISAGSLKKEIEFKQEKAGATALTISKQSILSADKETTKTIDITTDGDWTISELPEWCTVDQKTGNSNSTVTITIKANTTALERTGNIVITANLLSEKLLINQWSKDKGTINIEKAGTLKDILEDVGSTNINELIITGELNEYDFFALGTSKIPNLNMQEAKTTGTETISDKYFAKSIAIKSIILPKGITTIDENAFTNCENLTTVAIPDGVTSIGKAAFRLCKKLNNIAIPNSVLSIGNSAFQDCSSLATITLPSNLKSIGHYAFTDCISLTAINIPNSVTEIGQFAFTRCENMKTVNIPSQLKEIQAYTFLSCKELTSIKIPDSVTSIQVAAFAGTNIESFVIHANIETVGVGILDQSGVKSLTIESNKFEFFTFSEFTRTEQLKEVHLKSKTPITNHLQALAPREPYNAPTPIRNLYIPKGTMAAYKKAMEYLTYQFTNIIEE